MLWRLTIILIIMAYEVLMVCVTSDYPVCQCVQGLEPKFPSDGILQTCHNDAFIRSLLRYIPQIIPILIIGIKLKLEPSLKNRDPIKLLTRARSTR
ncbi:hypothetical protein CASFOL_030475 [Castilleja foliolosa]|uniref:Uncharacterized protein n=1 Tax=Castilleja foliolosa TaxID=1961234 RepID=A0ABD3C8F1_9LAMI